MTKKTRLTILAAIAVVVAAIVVLLLLRKGGETPPAPEEPAYDRSQNPEYQKIIDFEQKTQARTMAGIARARQNLADAQQDGLEPEIIKELEAEVEAAEKQLALDRERMNANIRREIWKEQHPEHVKVLEQNRADEMSIMAQIADAQKRLDAAKAQAASDEEIARLSAELDELVKKLVENHKEADKKLMERGK